jgi:hypothetical protein
VFRLLAAEVGDVTAPSPGEVLTRSNFQLESGTTLEPVPQGADQRIYEPGVRHIIGGTGSDGITEGGLCHGPSGTTLLPRGGLPDCAGHRPHP